MNTVSAVVLTKNEEVMLPLCLASLGWVDEILVVDSFSTDKTVEIAEKAGARVLQHKFENFAAQFNWGIEQARGPWIFMIDADEVVDENLQAALRGVLAADPPFDVYNIVRDAFFLGRRMRSSAWSNEVLPRLFRKGCLEYKGLVHPITDVGGRPMGRLKGRLLHYTYRSMAQYFDKLRLYADLWAKNAFNAGRRVGLPTVFLKSGWRFFHTFFLRGEIIDGSYGLLTATLSTIYTFEKYIKLWGLCLNDNKKGN